MSFSKVDICNKALGHLGQAKIADLSESSNNAVQLSYVYNSVRDAALRAADWGFARRIETMNQLSAETIPGWNYLYAYPNKAVSIHKIFSDASSEDPEPENYLIVLSPTTNVKAIATQISPAYAHYTYQVDDSTIYDADFVEAFAFMLAAEVAFELTGNTDLVGPLNKKADDVMSEAMRVSTTERQKDDKRTSSYENSRA